ncbi:MAG TPA: glycosyltransferase family 39 protein [Candidatus Binataceae bacterium]|nr:glycosyltransferase family 39 protein [Candidatus Binataceae bacterium]
MSRRKSAPARASAAEPAKIAVWLLAVLLAARLARLFYSEVWVEDDFYLESAFLVSAGMRPYLDFVHPHMPVLEWIAGAYLRLFGASHLSIELLNEAAIYATSLLVFALGRRAAGRRAAIASAILYGFSSLVFRYHVYERECFVAPLVVAAAILAIDRRWSRIRLCGALAAIMVLACSIKLTAAVPAAVIVGFIAIADRRWGPAILTALAIAGGLAILSAFLYWLYGFEFILQTFLFHLMKGHDTTLSIAAYPRLILDLLAPLFVLGLVELAASRALGRAMGLVLATAAAQYVFFGLMSPTAWAHNYLEPLPFVAIIASIGLLATLDALRAAVGGEDAAGAAWLRVTAAGALIAICLAWATPLVNESWLRGSVYGFGFIPRAEIAQIAAGLRDATGPADEVIAPSFICFEANRRELIRYPEMYGVWREAESEYRRDGLGRARENLSRADFLKLIAETAHFWRDPIKRAVTDGSVKAVINDSPIQLLPLVYLPDEFLAANGFHPAMRTEHFTLWLRAGAPGPN